MAIIRWRERYRGSTGHGCNPTGGACSGTCRSCGSSPGANEHAPATPRSHRWTGVELWGLTEWLLTTPYPHCPWSAVNPPLSCSGNGSQLWSSQPGGDAHGQLIEHPASHTTLTQFWPSFAVWRLCNSETRAGWSGCCWFHTHSCKRANASFIWWPCLQPHAAGELHTVISHHLPGSSGRCTRGCHPPPAATAN